MIIAVGNACDSYPCWNDAFCVPSNSSSTPFICICGSAHAGDLCQYKLSDFCNGQQCEEGSECTVRNGFTECVPHDALGKFNIISAFFFKIFSIRWMRISAFFSSCDDGLCLNGAQCVQVTADRYRCICAEGYQGIYCQLSDSTPFSTLSTATAIFLLGLLLLIALSALLICHSSNIGCYLVMPGEGSYARWDEEDEQNDDRIPLGIVKSDGLKASVTADTIVDLEGPSLQRTRETITL
ncbi:unnamed protein product [Toxocara canis]|uniref:EGF-like domain-containing protein n=1 Tax=Toxocara canis TaxID=6265 RepID=A0A183UA01_TOXCA|nr:unnamed protein product [Toxocara canis]